MPRRARAWGAAVLAPVLLLPVLSTPAHAEQEPDSDTPAVSTTGLIDDRAALTLAAETGEPVEITAATTETTRHLANPDGSFTMEQNALPVRVRDEDGWTPVDTDLVAGADGALRPRATVADIVFSGGGDRDLVSIGLGSNSIALGWHEDLPNRSSTATRPPTPTSSPTSTWS